MARIFDICAIAVIGLHIEGGKLIHIAVWSLGLGRRPPQQGTGCQGEEQGGFHR